jgi:2-oxoisovalerate dehydrogenase E1 component
LLPGDVGIHHREHADVLLVTYANGLRLGLRAARRLADDHGIEARVLDLRWLNPLPLSAVATHARECGAVVVVDECRATGGGVADAIVSHLAEGDFAGRLRTVRSADTYIPLGPAADLALVSEDQVIDAVRGL